MGSSLNFMANILDPFGVGRGALGLNDPDIPKATAPKRIDPLEAERLAEEKAKRRRQRASGGFGHSDTNLTGGKLGMAPPGATATKTLLGS